MKIAAQVLTVLFLFMWPMMVIFSGAAAQRGREIRFTLFLMLLPICIGVLYKQLNWSFLWFSPKTFLVISVVMSAVMIAISDYPHRLISKLRDVSATGYSVKDNAVYHAGKRLANADPKTFRILREHFSLGVDAQHVYYGSQIVADVDPHSFELIENSMYSRDASHVYHDHLPKRIPDAQPKSFRQLSTDDGKTDFWRDEKAIFLYGEKLQFADAHSFVPLGQGNYARDHTRVYLGTEVVEGADPTTFQILSDSFSKDARRVYKGTCSVFPMADAPSFRMLIADRIAVDSRHVYYIWFGAGNTPQVISNADPGTIQPLSRGYLKDANHVYYDNYESVEIVIGADPISFKIADLTDYPHKNKLDAEDKLGRYLRGQSAS